MSWEVFLLTIPFWLYMLGGVIWVLALIHIWFDADEVYGTGWFWMIMVLFVPLIAIPSYWLMKMGTHRSLDDDIVASERLKRKRAWRQAQGAARSKLLGDRAPDVEPGRLAGSKARKPFKPYSSSFAPAAEHLKEVAAKYRDSILRQPDPEQETKRETGIESPRKDAPSWHERLSWREQQLRGNGDAEVPF
jgi:hypothetical protein